MLCFGKRDQSVLNCSVELLDETKISLEMKGSAKGDDLLELVFSHLDLLEKDYFGLRFISSQQITRWVDPTKKIAAQLRGHGSQPVFYFGVKFYAVNPCKLKEELTRYLFFLQAKRDILQGRIPVSFQLGVELGALAVQSELGDCNDRQSSDGRQKDHGAGPAQLDDSSYVASFNLLPAQTGDHVSAIQKAHQGLRGVVPSEAELTYLEKVRNHEMYGVDLHAVKGESDEEYYIGLTPAGVVVYKRKTRLGSYLWPHIANISFNKREYNLEVRGRDNEQTTYVFNVSTKEACKHLWKCSVENHSFYRLSKNEADKGGKFFSLRSQFRYSGRTERQALSEVFPARAPPQVTRLSSRKGDRRLTDGGNITKTISRTFSEDSSGKLTIGSSYVTNRKQVGRVIGSETQGERNMASLPHRPESETSLQLMHAIPVIATASPEVSQPNVPSNSSVAPSGTKRVLRIQGNSPENVSGGLFTSGRDSPKSVRSDVIKFPGRFAPHDSFREEDGFYKPRYCGSEGGSTRRHHHHHYYHQHQHHHSHRQKDSLMEDESLVPRKGSLSQGVHRSQSYQRRVRRAPLPESLRSVVQYELVSTAGLGDRELQDMDMKYTEVRSAAYGSGPASEPGRARHHSHKVSPPQHYHPAPFSAEKQRSVSKQSNVDLGERSRSASTRPSDAVLGDRLNSGSNYENSTLSADGNNHNRKTRDTRHLDVSSFYEEQHGKRRVHHRDRNQSDHTNHRANYSVESYSLMNSDSPSEHNRKTMLENEPASTSNSGPGSPEAIYYNVTPGARYRTTGARHHLTALPTSGSSPSSIRHTLMSQQPLQSTIGKSTAAEHATSTRTPAASNTPMVSGQYSQPMSADGPGRIVSAVGPDRMVRRGLYLDIHLGSPSDSDRTPTSFRDSGISTPVEKECTSLAANGWGASRIKCSCGMNTCSKTCTRERCSKERSADVDAQQALLNAINATFNVSSSSGDQHQNFSPRRVNYTIREQSV